jgi:4-hydroxy-tetrahydrodipicolinate synthase
MMKNILTGVVPALTLPFNADRSIDFQGFRRLIELVIADGVHGLLVNGCTGESWALSDDERCLVFETAVDASRKRVPVIVGCGAMSAETALHKVRQAEKAGCDAVMIQPPWYVMPNLDEVKDYYLEVMDACSLPVVIYNIPRRTGINLTPDLVDRLADHPRACALKESSKDFLLLTEMIRRVSDRIDVFAGYANLLGLGALAHGAVGYMDSSTPVLGRKSREFFDAATRGDIATARRLHGEMTVLNQGFFGVGTFPAGVKAALDMLGRPGGHVRPPIRNLDEAQRAKIRAALVAAKLLPAAMDRAAE